YSKIGKNSIKGMSLIFSAGFDEKETIPKRLVPLAMVSTWITHLFGGSAGREGVAVQIGGTVGHAVGRKLGLKDNKSKILLITGMAAGFAGLFHTPLAAIFFAMELLTAGVVEYSALFPCIIAAFVANYTSLALGLEKSVVNLNCSLELNVYLILKIVLLGILFGIIGGLFAYALNFSKKFFSKSISNPILRIFIMGCILSVLFLLLHKGRYSGLGSNLITAAFSNGKVYGYDWILKFILTILTLSVGFQGGEVTPLFSIGASLGAIIAPIFGLPIEFVAALGYVALFGSGTNTILAPIFIGGEIFGFDYLPHFFVVSSIAYVFNGNKSIYSSQKILNNF
ncbi:MAG: voltage-gated chloride channel protein, partial [Clostridiales bacterium]|nr:voltage-gated chloride channel protein [Clostridiales bacterium]